MAIRVMVEFLKTLEQAPADTTERNCGGFAAKHGLGELMEKVEAAAQAP